MKIEIRKEIREYILGEINTTLARLGVSENVKETTEYDNTYEGLLHYQFESAPIRQFPMMFKNVIVKGYLVAVEQKDDSPYARFANDCDIVLVHLDYSYQHFDMGSNGCHIGSMVFAIKKNLPEKFEDFAGKDGRDYFVYKLKGLTI